MIESVIGLVLRTRPLTETSLIVHWLTPDLGRLATVAKGARRTKSPFRGKLDLFYLADLSFSRSRRSDLHTLREVNLRNTHRSLREELTWLQQASYCALLIEQATETETPLPAVFALMNGFLNQLPSRKPGPEAVLAFETKLLNELGLQPDLTTSGLSLGSRQVFMALECSDWATISNLRLSYAQTVELGKFLHDFLLTHLGRIPKGRSAALAF